MSVHGELGAAQAEHEDAGHRLLADPLKRVSSALMASSSSCLRHERRIVKKDPLGGIPSLLYKCVLGFPAPFNRISSAFIGSYLPAAYVGSTVHFPAQMMKVCSMVRKAGQEVAAAMPVVRALLLVFFCMLFSVFGFSLWRRQVGPTQARLMTRRCAGVSCDQPQATRTQHVMPHATDDERTSGSQQQGAHLRYSRVHSPRSSSRVFRMTCTAQSTVRAGGAASAQKGTQ